MSMTDFIVLDATCSGDREAWLAIWNDSDHREPFAHPTYVALFAGDGRPLCAVSQSRALMLPFILRPIDPGSSELHDIISPYAYGGPFGASSDVRGLKSFWDELTHWASAHNVVSEFIRFSLHASNRGYPGEVRTGQDNVVRSLSPTIEDIWRDAEHKVRKNVQKAERCGVVVHRDDDTLLFDEFWNIYRSTMDRRDAAARYYFEREFFEAVHQMKGSFTYFHATLQGEVISSELVLSSARYAYSFLGGTRAEQFAVRPNDLLKYRIIQWAKESGREAFVLGGGYGCNDGIFRYKQSFAPQGGKPFFTGRRILNPAAYARLVDARAMTSTTVDSSFFPAYRA